MSLVIFCACLQVSANDMGAAFGTPTVGFIETKDGPDPITGSAAAKDGWIYRILEIVIPKERITVYGHLDLPVWTAEVERKAREQIRCFLDQEEKKNRGKFSLQYRKDFEERGIELMRGKAAHFPFYRPVWSWDAQYQTIELLTQFMRYYGYTAELRFCIEVPWMPKFTGGRIECLPERESVLCAAYNPPVKIGAVAPTAYAKTYTPDQFRTRVVYQLGYSVGAAWTKQSCKKCKRFHPPDEDCGDEWPGPGPLPPQPPVP